jgi:hypothetical protein
MFLFGRTAAGPTKKPTTVSSRGLLSKVSLGATSPSGLTRDDYPDELGYDDDLQRDPIH